MRKLIYYVAVTLDGFVAGPDGADPSGTEFLPIYPDVVEYITSHLPETLPTPARTALGVEDVGRTFDTVLEGRASYEGGVAQGVTNAYQHLRHVVFSTTLEAADPTVEIVRGDPLDFVRQLKQQDGKDIWIVGGGKIAHSLLPEIDRVIVKRTPSVIGNGVPMFNGPFRFAMFKPVESKVLDSGVEVAVYDRA